MTNYKEYNDAKLSVISLIETKEHEILDIEKEVVHLKKVRRMLDDEFRKGMEKKPKYLG